MTDAHHASACQVKTSEDSIKQVLLAVFEKTASGVCAKICHLDHARQAAVNKQGRFNDSLHTCPQGSLRMETPHQAGDVFRDRLVVVLDQQSMIINGPHSGLPALSNTFTFAFREKCVKPCDHLLKRLFEHVHTGWGRGFVHSFRK